MFSRIINCFLLIALSIGFNASILFANDDIMMTSPSEFCSCINRGHGVFQLGYNWSYQGKAQHINIVDLIGDQFTLKSHSDGNLLVGLGYFLEGLENDLMKISYGINAFYLAKTTVSGNVIQENLYTNLAYRYKIQHWPIYAVAKSSFNINSQYALNADVGLGVNVMCLSNFKETPLDTMTIPDRIFSSRTTPQFSATVGVGIKCIQIFEAISLEIGYRFFYLGQGNFHKQTSQALNTLKTGNCYGNAITFSIEI